MAARIRLTATFRMAGEVAKLSRMYRSPPVPNSGPGSNATLAAPLEEAGRVVFFTSRSTPPRLRPRQ
jgi:hypothetical protein